jgi:hypothetical protein
MAGNSWQQPVAGEPSWGSPHTHEASLLSNYNIADANWRAVDLSAHVPVGTRAATFHYQVTSTSTHALYFSTASGGTVYFKTFVPIANGYALGQFSMPVTAERTIYYQGENAAMAGFYLNIDGYFI